MESRIIQKKKMIDICELTGHLIHQIHYAFTCKAQLEDSRVINSLNFLLSLSSYQALELLHVCNDTGWCYAQLLASRTNPVVIDKYFILLVKLSNEPSLVNGLFDLLCLKDTNGYILGRRGSMQNKRDYLSLLSDLYKKQGTEQALSKIQSLMEEKDLTGKCFLYDIVRPLHLKIAASVKDQYCDLIYWVAKHDFLTEKGIKLFTSIDNQLANYILALPDRNKKMTALKNVFNENCALGKIFALQPKEKNTKLREKLRDELNQIRSYETSISDYDVPTDEVFKPMTRSRVSSRLWSFFAPMPDFDGNSNDIPLQTFSTGVAKMNDQSKLG